MSKAKLCSFCGSPNIYAKDLCRNCYSRRQRTGSPEYLGHMHQTTIDILAKLKAGESQSKIAKEFGVTRQRVSAIKTKYYKHTNADRIRSMTNKELAEFIDSLIPECRDSECIAHEVCAKSNPELSCGERFLLWLKKEAKDGDTD